MLSKYLNKIICGDCLEIMREIPNNNIDLVVTDPPYMFGPASTAGKGNTKISKWGDLLNQSYFYTMLIDEFARLLRADSAIWMFSNWRGLPVMMKAVVDADKHVESLLVWDKEWIGPGGPIGLRPSYELVLLIPIGNWSIPNRGLPDIWRSKWSSTKPHGHPAEKPINLIKKIIMESPGQIVLDPFCGSGPVPVACRSLGRDFIGIDCEPKWCEMTEKRLSQEVLAL